MLGLKFLGELSSEDSVWKESVLDISVLEVDDVLSTLDCGELFCVDNLIEDDVDNTELGE